MDDEQAVHDAVSDVLSKDGWLRSATGRLREYRELFASTDASVASAPDKWSVAVKKLAIVRMTPGTAVVDLDAVRHYEVPNAAGQQTPVVQHYSGPIEVVREPDGWKVPNLIVDGVSLADSVCTTSELAGSVAGVEVIGLAGGCSPREWSWRWWRRGTDLGDRYRSPAHCWGGSRGMAAGAGEKFGCRSPNYQPAQHVST